MMDFGPHDDTCANATDGTCRCDCEGAQHGAAHLLAQGVVAKPSTYKRPDGRVEVRGPNGRPPGGGTRAERIAARSREVTTKTAPK